MTCDFIFRLPDLGDAKGEARLARWHAAPGDIVAEGQLIAEVGPPGATIDIAAPLAGQVRALYAAAGDVALVGSPLILFEVRSSGAAPARSGLRYRRYPAIADGQAGPVGTHVRKKVKASPATRARAKAQGVDLHALEGSGPDGRILDLDLAAVVGRREKD